MAAMQTTRSCSSNCLDTASPASRLKSAPTRPVVGAGLGRDAGDAVLEGRLSLNRVACIATKVGSYAVRGRSRPWPRCRQRGFLGYGVDAIASKLCSHSVRRPSVAAEGSVMSGAVYPVQRGVCDATWQPLLRGAAQRAGNASKRIISRQHRRATITRYGPAVVADAGQVVFVEQVVDVQAQVQVAVDLVAQHGAVDGVA